MKPRKTNLRAASDGVPLPTHTHPRAHCVYPGARRLAELHTGRNDNDGPEMCTARAGCVVSRELGKQEGAP